MLQWLSRNVAIPIAGWWLGLYLSEKDTDDGAKILAAYKALDERRRQDMFIMMLTTKSGIRNGRTMFRTWQYQQSSGEKID